MLSATSLDSTLEGLKQGNALEQEFIKKLKEGLEFIADNMQKECYNRTDALVEVCQKLAKERATGHGHITADQKAVLASIIKINILMSEKAIEDSQKAFKKTTGELHITREADRKEHQHAMYKSTEEKKGLNDLADTINALRNAVAADQLRAVMSVWEERLESIKKEGLCIKREWDLKYDAAFAKQKKEKIACKEHIRVLEAIATAAGIDSSEIE